MQSPTPTPSTKIPAPPAVRCYVTGKKKNESALNSYYFGSEAHVVLTLSQEVFAHFIIRAGKDTMHQQIMKELREANDNIDDFLNKNPLPPLDDDEYIDASIEKSILVDKMANLLTQKAESGVRILRQMKKDYEATGRLSS